MDVEKARAGESDSPKRIVLEQVPKLSLNGKSALMDAVEDVIFGSVRSRSPISLLSIIQIHGLTLSRLQV
jgi:hypothetical protein